MMILRFDPFNSDGHANVPAKVIQQIGFYLVRASRTWDGVISFGSELFRRTIATAQAQPASAVLTERDRLRNPDAPIDRDDRIQPLVQSIDAELAHFFLGVRD
jgi:putative ATP-dependent endonuclease of OLD family